MVPPPPGLGNDVSTIVLDYLRPTDMPRAPSRNEEPIAAPRVVSASKCIAQARVASVSVAPGERAQFACQGTQTETPQAEASVQTPGCGGWFAMSFEEAAERADFSTQTDPQSTSQLDYVDGVERATIASSPLEGSFGSSLSVSTPAGCPPALATASSVVDSTVRIAPVQSSAVESSTVVSSTVGAGSSTVVSSTVVSSAVGSSAVDLAQSSTQVSVAAPRFQRKVVKAQCKSVGSEGAVVVCGKSSAQSSSHLSCKVHATPKRDTDDRKEFGKSCKVHAIPLHNNQSVGIPSGAVGSSAVGSVVGSSTVGSVVGSSAVGSVAESSTVGDSTVGSSTVGSVMRSQAKGHVGSTTVGSATVESSTVGGVQPLWPPCVRERAPKVFTSRCNSHSQGERSHACFELRALHSHRFSD